MKIKTAVLKERALDWAVAKCWWCDEFDSQRIWVHNSATRILNNPTEFPESYQYSVEWKPSTDWAQGGLIIERLSSEGLELVKTDWPEPNNKFRASLDTPNKFYYGPTPLIAAMRCYVASKLGNEVEVPDNIQGP